MKIISIFLVLLSACSGFQNIKPDINLVDLEIKEVKLLETTLLATIRIHNDSNRTISFSGSTHKIYINDMELGRATSSESVNISKLSSSDYVVPVRIGSIGVITKLQRLIEAKDFRYRIDSTLYQSGTFGLGSVTTTNSGTLSGLS